MKFGDSACFHSAARMASAAWPRRRRSREESWLNETSARAPGGVASSANDEWPMTNGERSASANSLRLFIAVTDAGAMPAEAVGFRAIAENRFRLEWRAELLRRRSGRRRSPVVRSNHPLRRRLARPPAPTIPFRLLGGSSALQREGSIGKLL